MVDEAVTADAAAAENQAQIVMRITAMTLGEVPSGTAS
jgi:hypothetical protein